MTVIGHQQILKSRSNRMKPTAIFFEFREPPQAPIIGDETGIPMPLRRIRRSLRDAIYDPESAIDAACFPVIYVDPEDLKSHLDLRFVKDCQAHISAPKWSRDLIDFGERIAAYGASIVVLNAIDECGDMMVFSDGEWRSLMA